MLTSFCNRCRLRLSDVLQRQPLPVIGERQVNRAHRTDALMVAPRR